MNRRKLLTLLPASLLGLSVQNSEANTPILNTMGVKDIFNIVAHHTSETLITKSSNKLNCAYQLISDEVRYIDYAHDMGQFKSSIEDVKKSVKYYLFYGEIPRSEWINVSKLEKYNSISYEALCEMDRTKSGVAFID